MADFHIYLASRSPRRRELLDQIGIRYRVQDVNIPEQHQPGEAPEDFVCRLALEKARAGYRETGHGSGIPVLGADTVVVLDDELLGKPTGRSEGLEMLSRLSGNVHSVLTAVALVTEQETVKLNTSQVWFRATTAGEREAYWASGEPRDKAGAYAIQGMAAAWISRIEGSFSGVMGLPLFETAELLHESGIEIFHAGSRPEQQVV